MLDAAQSETAVVMRLSLSLSLFSVLLAGTAFAATISVDVEAFQRAESDVEIEVALVLDEPIVLTGTSPAQFVFDDVPAGTWGITLSAPGFDAISETLVVAGDRDLTRALFPAADVMLDGTVGTADGSPLEGASVRVSGERLAVPRTASSDADGRFTFEALPAGYYDVEVSPEDGVRMVRSDVDVLADASLVFMAPDAAARAEIDKRRTLSCTSAGSVGTWSWLGALAAAYAFVGPRRRRRS